MTGVVKLDLKKIRLDGGTQPRAELLIEVVEDYAEQMRNGDTFPPITVFFDGRDYWLADGFHRVTASQKARPAEPIEAEVIQGTRSDAQWYSYGVNKAHGLRRSNPDKARAVRAALLHPKGSTASDRQIAEHVGVHFDTVTKYRRQLEDGGTIGKSDSRTGRDGRTINTAHIGKHSSEKNNRNGRSKPAAISRNARTPVLGHSEPCPMIPLQFSPNNPQTAAATLIQKFAREFVQALVRELKQRLVQQGEES
jgi:hypothetical protein